jgi:hypothetical protein
MLPYALCLLPSALRLDTHSYTRIRESPRLLTRTCCMLLMPYALCLMPCALCLMPCACMCLMPAYTRPRACLSCVPKQALMRNSLPRQERVSKRTLKPLAVELSKPELTKPLATERQERVSKRTLKPLAVELS